MTKIKNEKKKDETSKEDSTTKKVEEEDDIVTGAAFTFPRKFLVAFGSIQILCCILSIVSEIILMLCGHNPPRRFEIGTGLWCGIIFGISSGTNLIAAIKPTNCRIVSALALCIWSGIACIPLLTFSTLELTSIKDINSKGTMFIAFLCVQIVVGCIIVIGSIMSAIINSTAITWRKRQYLENLSNLSPVLSEKPADPPIKPAGSKPLPAGWQSVKQMIHISKFLRASSIEFERQSEVVKQCEQPMNHDYYKLIF